MKDLDRAAAWALATVDHTAASQLRALAALQAVVDIADDDGLISGFFLQFRDERQQAFVRFHERILKNEDHALHGAALQSAWDEALAFTRGVAGEGVETAALAARQQVALSSSLSFGAQVPEAPALPFFARFLEQQKR